MKRWIKIKLFKKIISNIFYFIFLQNGTKNMQIRLTSNHNWKAVFWLSINFPAIHGTVKELIPKHWEYKARAEPRYLIGEDFIIESDADGRNIHREIVKGMKAKSINRYPLSNKFESDKKIKPINSDIKHNLNLKGEFLFLKM